MTMTPTAGGGLRVQELNAFEQTAAAAGVTLPKKYVDAAAEHRRRVTAARLNMTAYQGPSLTDAMMAAINDARDPHEDADVMRAVAAGQLAERLPDVAVRLNQAERQILRDHRDAIVKACAKPVTEAYEAIRTAVDTAPNLHRNSDAETVMRSGSTAAGAWMLADDAQKRLRALTVLLKKLPKVRIHETDEPWLHLEPTLDLPGDALRSEWDAARAGADLSWCGDLSTLAARLAQLDDLRHQRTRAQHEAMVTTKRSTSDLPIVLAEAEVMDRRRRATEAAGG